MKTKPIILTNKTHYNSKDLIKLFTLVFREYKRTAFNLKFPTIRITCEYRRIKDGFCGGYAYYNANYIEMRLPKIKAGYGNDTFEQNITRTFLHELDHCRGMKHGSMPNDLKRNISYLPADLIVREKKPKVKIKKTDDLKIQALLIRKKGWESKLKRCNTALKKIAKQIKYYEKKQQNQPESV